MTKKPTPMTPEAARRIQIAEAKKNNGKIIKGGRAAEAMKKAAKNIATD